MKSRSAIGSVPDIEENEVHLYYRLQSLDFEDGPRTTLGHLAAAADESDPAILPKDQVVALSTRYQDQQIWEPALQDGRPVQQTPISTDLHPAVRSLLSGERPELLKRWRLHAQAAQFVASADLYAKDVDRDIRTKKVLCLRLGARATSRLGRSSDDAAMFRLDIRSLEIVAFATGTSFLIARVRIKRPGQDDMSAAELTEAVHAVSRFNTCCWRAAEDLKAIEGPDFSLGKMLHSLVQPEVSDRVLTNRVTSYVFARTTSSMESSSHDAFCFYLARRYTSDYAMDLENVSLRHIRDFENVRHAVSEDGMASVIRPTDEDHLSISLENWRSSVMQTCYSPIVLLALHENWFLNLKRADAVTAQAGEDAITVLQGIVDSALLFRLWYRFSSVSDISMHNAISRALRDVLALDRKLDEMQDDVEAMKDCLVSAEREQNEFLEAVRHRRFYAIGVFSAAALAGLTAHQIAKELLGPMLADSPDPVATGAGLVGLLAAFLSFGYGLLKRPRVAPNRSEDRETLDGMRQRMLVHMLRRP